MIHISTLVIILLIFIIVALVWHYQRRLVLHRDNLQFALQSGSMGTWNIDLSNDTLTCSPEMLKLWEIDPEAFDGDRKIPQSKVHPEDLPKMKEAILLAIKDESIYEMEYRIIPTSGPVKWVFSRGRCQYSLQSHRPIRFSGIVYEITEKKNRENDIEKFRKTRDQFFMIASHELKTPLTSLQLLLNVGQWDLKNRPQDEELLGKISSTLFKQQNHINRINRVVNHILDESRISAGRLIIQPENFDLGEMVFEILDQFKLNLEAANIQIETSPFINIPGTWDRFRLEQVLLNLLMNAVRYGKNGPVKVIIGVEGDKAYFSVEDNGIGIDNKDKERIFERFERAVPELESNGMGLGLFISNNIVRAHGGEIILRSELGQGSSFTVVLPTSLEKDSAYNPGIMSPCSSIDTL